MAGNSKHKRFDYQSARRYVRQKSTARARRNALLLERARADFERIVAMIRDKYDPARIYQWGSLLKEGEFSEISDIDIAVEGVANAADFFAMAGEAQDLTEFPLDLVEIEKIEPLHAQSIRERGRMVYERPR